MAKVIPASFIKSIHGHIGNIILYNVNGNQYARSYTIPRNPRTKVQQKNRTAFAEAVKLWQKLSDEDKSCYNLMAKGKPLTGYNLFISMNMKGITHELKKQFQSTPVIYSYTLPILQRVYTSVSPSILLYLNHITSAQERFTMKKPPGIMSLAA